MWLIDTTILTLKLFARSEGVEYAILSHTWGGDDDEVTFQDMADVTRREKKTGWNKIKKTCQLAKEMKLDYAWVDTCCIDKTSSAELSEAINSMFSWYRNSKICFVYLSTPIDTSSPEDDDLAGYRWFQRGWTLQELIAPSNMTFFDENWVVRGTKETLRDRLVEITGIDAVVLKSVETLQTINIGRRFSWAAKRETKRVEDIAYCLLGIFGINMPLLYGEGSRAFLRLQEEIARSTNDLTLFAWQQDKRASNWQLSGIFANSPSEFRRCGKLLVPRGKLEAETEFTLTNRGLRFDRSFDVGYHTIASGSREQRLPEGDLFMRLDCLERSERTHHEARWVGIALRKIGTTYLRLFPEVLHYCSSTVTHHVSQVEKVVYITTSLSDSDAEIINKHVRVGIFHHQNMRGIISRRENPHLSNLSSFQNTTRHVDTFGSGGLRSCMHLHFFTVSLARAPKAFRMALVCGLRVRTSSEGAQDSPWAFLCSEEQFLESVPRAASYGDLFGPEPAHREISRQERIDFFRDYVFERYLDESGHINQMSMPDSVIVECPDTPFAKHVISLHVGQAATSEDLSLGYDHSITLSYHIAGIPTFIE